MFICFFYLFLIYLLVDSLWWAVQLSLISNHLSLRCDGKLSLRFTSRSAPVASRSPWIRCFGLPRHSGVLDLTYFWNSFLKENLRDSYRAGRYYLSTDNRRFLFLSMLLFQMHFLSGHVSLQLCLLDIFCSTFVSSLIFLNYLFEWLRFLHGRGNLEFLWVVHVIIIEVLLATTKSSFGLFNPCICPFHLLVLCERLKDLKIDVKGLPCLPVSF